MDYGEDLRKIHIGTDHAGFELKEALVEYLEQKGFNVIDHGAYEFDEEDDYVDYVAPVAREVSSDHESKGIILGGSGQGEAMLANRFPGVRAVAYYGGDDLVDSRDGLGILALSRLHNDSNVLSLGARFLSEDQAKEALETWLETEFDGDEKYARRIVRMDQV